jgi:hypothetical protein
MKPKMIHGIAINDADYNTQPVSGMCIFYCRWLNMISRCYASDDHNNPTYKNCSVCDEWLYFSNFKFWMEKQDFHGKDLDKDILNQGNNTYSPENCIFVSAKINNLLLTNKAKRGSFMLGVSFCKQIKRFKSACNVDGKRKHIGCYDSEVLAHKAYKIFKYKLIKSVALEQTEPLRSALLNYKIGEY